MQNIGFEMQSDTLYFNVFNTLQYLKQLLQTLTEEYHGTNIVLIVFSSHFSLAKVIVCLKKKKVF